MKRFVLTFLLLLALPGVCFAAQSALSGDGYRQALSGYDLSAFEKLGDDANSVLEQLGLDDFDFETVTALDAKSCVQVLGRLTRQNIQTPLRALLSHVPGKKHCPKGKAAGDRRTVFYGQ